MRIKLFSLELLLFLTTLLQTTCQTSEEDSSTSSEYKGTLLAGGTFSTKTDVSEQADIALDIRDMQESITTSEDFITARNIYIAGSNSDLFDKSGNMQPYKRSLQSMSLDPTLMDHMTYNIHLYGLSSGILNASDYVSYTNDYILDLFGKESPLATEAIVALTLGMYITHEIWDSVLDCAEAVDNTLSSTYTLTNNENNVRSFDTAIAYYIGTGQEPGSSDGYSFYTLAQNAAQRFGTLDSGIALANEKIRLYYEVGSIDLSVSNACETKERFKTVWTISNLFVNAMMIPLMQMLISSIVENDAERIKLYALAIVPQTSVCKASSYRKLMEELIHKPFNPNYMTEVINELQSNFDCLGITCEDVGAYMDHHANLIKLAQCADRPDTYPLAGYNPTTNVHQMAKLDLDLNEIEILTKLEKNNFAKYIYQFGKHSHLLDVTDQSFRSLEYLATYTERQAVPFFELYEDYFNDQSYVDTRAMSVFNNKHWDNALQRSTAISVILRYQLIYMAILAELQDSIKDCEAKDRKDNDGQADAWDEVAALIIGSLEGPEIGGASYQHDGKLFYHLANLRCQQFQVCNMEQYASLNTQIIHLLYAGQPQLRIYDCVNLKSTVRQISHLLLIPLVQSALHYAILNADTPLEEINEDIVAGQEFAYTLLPILADIAPVAAVTVSDNMIAMPGETDVTLGAQRSPDKVGDALYELLKEFRIKCKFVGATESGFDACTTDALREERLKMEETAQEPVFEKIHGFYIGLGVFLVLLVFGIAYAIIKIQPDFGED